MTTTIEIDVKPLYAALIRLKAENDSLRTEVSRLQMENARLRGTLMNAIRGNKEK